MTRFTTPRFLAAALALTVALPAIVAPSAVAQTPEESENQSSKPELALQWIVSRTIGESSEGFMTLMTPQRMSLIEGPTEKLYDFERRRLVVLDQEKKEWINTSLYSDVAYRERRMANLEFLRSSLSAADLAEADVPTPLQAEVLFGIPNAEPVLPAIDSGERGGAVTWTLNGEPSVTMQPSGEKIPEGMGRVFERWLAYNTQIHPSIRDRIVARGERPLWLRFRHVRGSELVEQTLQWEVVRTVPANWAKHFEGLRPATLDDSASAIAAHRVVSGELRQPPAPETFQSVSKQAVERGDMIGAMLAQLAALVSTGQENSEESRKIAAKSDARELALQEAVKLQVTDPQRSLELLDSLDLGDREYAYVVDVFRADAYLALGQTEVSLDRFDRALEKDPYLVGAYADLAAFHFRGFRMAFAWLYWDAARILRPNHPLVAEVEELEASLVRRFPAFF